MNLMSHICTGTLSILALTLMVANVSADDQLSNGPDVILSDIPSVATFGPVNGIRAYALGSGTCNIGSQDLEWVNNGSPGLAMNAYRLYDGRLMQIGMSWAKTACCAANGAGCGVSCTSGGTGLHVGCRDVYTASWNSSQSRLAPRSGINPYTGEFSPIPSGSGDAIWRRLQIAETDLTAANFPNATYFVEGVYASRGDSMAQNWLNNASYQRASFTSFQLGLLDSVIAKTPAIYAWRDYGNGPGVPDRSVQMSVVDIPGEGRFIAGAKVKDNGNGTWRYDYAIYNLNSNRSGGMFKVPIPANTIITNAGFHDVNYHSGEVYDNTDWVFTQSPAAVTWSSPQTFDQNPNSNALRWGTMYNFWFTANRAPAPGPGPAPGNGTVNTTLALFRPGTPDSVVIALPAPYANCVADIAPAGGDGTVNTDDLLSAINNWGPCLHGSNCAADLNFDQIIDIDDLLAIINGWGGCP
jgi:hypothetical protein